MIEQLLNAGSDGALTALAWLLTYLLHSSLLLGGTWLLLRFWRTAGDATKEALWKFGLLGGLASASLQVGLGVVSFGGVVPLLDRATETAAVEAAFVAAEPETPDESIAALGHAKPWLEVVSEAAWLLPSPDELAGASGSVVELQAGEDARRPFPWQPLLGVLAAVLLLAPLTVAWSRMRAYLAHRRDVTDHGMRERLDALCAKAGFRSRVRLTCSERIAAPIALGIVRPEICVPPRALDSLSAAEQECMLAHELAHLARRDPAWLAFCKLLECVLFLQPLNRVARKQLQEIAEYRCDAWAARLTAEGGLGLARCLAAVAEWLVPTCTPSARGFAAMAENPSHLAQRIRRLIDDRDGKERAGAAPAVFAALLLVPLTFTAPTIRAQEGSAANLSSADAFAPAKPSDPQMALLSEALQELDAELAALDREIASLRNRMFGLPEEGKNLLEIIIQLERKAEEIRESRSALDPR